MKQLDDKEIFGSKFQDFGAAPSDAVWKGIEAAIPQEKKKKRGAFWWWTTGIAASLFFIYIGLHGVEFTSAPTSPSIQHSNTSDPSATINDRSLQESIVQKNTQVKNTQLKKLIIKTSKPVIRKHLRNNTSIQPNQTNQSTDQQNVAINASIARAQLRKKMKFPLWVNKPNLLVQIDSTSNFVQIPAVDTIKKRKWSIGLVAEQTFHSNWSSKSFAPMVTEPINITPVYSYDWFRSRSIALDARLQVSRHFIIGSGFEYAHWDNFKKLSENLKASSGASIGIPIHFTYVFNPKHKLNVGLQGDLRNRFFFLQSDTTAAPPLSLTGSFDYAQFNAEYTTVKTKQFQSQFGLGLSIHWNITPHIGWNTVAEIQSSGFRSQDLRTRLSGNWLGIKSGIYYQF